MKKKGSRAGTSVFFLSSGKYLPDETADGG
jgi:hypothetical protein